MSPPETTAVRIRGGVPLRGAVQVGPDLPVLESAVALAALASGSSQLQGVLACAQLDTLLAAWNALGAVCERDGTQLNVQGAGLRGLRAPRAELAAGRSPQLLAQLAAVLCAQPFGTRITLQAAGAEQPVEQLVGGLRARGGQIGAQTGAAVELRPPIAVAPLLDSEHLQGIDATLPFADLETKSALLLSGLYAVGATTVSEPQVSSDSLERMMVALGLPLRRIGGVVALDALTEPSVPPLGVVTLPGSVEVSAYLAALVHWLPGSDITLRNVSVNPARAAVLDVLRSWGGALSLQPHGDAALREPIADVRIQHARLRGGIVDAELLVRAHDTVPALALLAPLAQRGIRMYDLAALSARADPQWRRLDALFRAFGLTIARAADELRIAAQSVPVVDARKVDAADDPALALCACTLALASRGETVVEHAADPLRALHPGFVPAVQQLGGSIEFV